MSSFLHYDVVPFSPLPSSSREHDVEIVEREESRKFVLVLRLPQTSETRPAMARGALTRDAILASLWVRGDRIEPSKMTVSALPTSQIAALVAVVLSAVDIDRGDSPSESTSRLGPI